ncbi:DNA-binding response regulator [Pseudoclavibacter sp. RFBJ3]|uniref:response regulator transcription factor n=1 Tax=unclassified Pseudoclavibacter TaxID=2615177 RepID=UPI000CE7A840|nr:MULTISPECIES: response regulator transcription factor [unclassified Pseudoclavibacter]PPF81527.1 DNA-binding response regulator [Pseudoclavibacter sp. RFBJ5]PPF90857.1 DNA-binding response regulator [Pseudoclavibacter sp. RFBJ3]PPG00133.1 DNA-binding response regulator [Pseudoclavibacter sp. RFBH5]PPG19991.1 DNA-binding response regulator [Pseudoclavibacter sp. RFBI4]
MTGRSSPKIRVLLVDDQELVRMGTALTLDAADDIEVVGEADTGESAIRRTRELKPDVVLMDVRMPGMGGIEATRIITTVHPSTRVLVLTTFDVDEYAFGGLDAGASAFLLKSTPPDRLREAVRTVHSGEAVVEPRITRQLIDHYASGGSPHGRSMGSENADPLGQLSPRERDVFGCMVAGLSNSEICETLHLSPATVKTHVNRIFAKLHLRDRVHAVILGHELRGQWRAR